MAWLAAAYSGICLLLFLAQRSLLYFPQPLHDRSGVPMRLAGDVMVSTRPLPGPDAVIYFGGNAEDVSLSLPEFRAAFPGHAIYLLHYRGYGGSAGRPSEAGLFADAMALYEEVHKRHANIVLIGRSLGSGLAVRLAAQRPVQRLVLVTPYDSILGIAQQQFPIFLVRWLLLDKYESWAYAPLVTAPTRILAAEHDEVIPRASTELLRTRFRHRDVTYFVIPNAGHNTISEAQSYWPLVRAD